MVKTISTVLTVLFALVWMIFFRPVYLGGPASYIIISGVSMEPTFLTGDLVVMHKAEQYQKGDVIAYQVEKKNVIHRIVGGSASSGFLTQGDNKPEIDPWTPKPADILGKLWFHVPQAGDKLNNLGSPLGMASLAGLTVLLFIDDLFPEKKKTHRGKRMKNNPTGSLLFRLTTPAWLTANNSTRSRQIAAWLLPVTVAGLVLGAIFLAAAVFTAFQPARAVDPVTRTLYRHNAVFHYTVSTLPSPLSSDTLIGPVGPETAIDGEVQSVITDLAQAVDIDLKYALTDLGASDLSGQVKTMLRIEIGEEWKQSFPIGEPVFFHGPTVETRITIPMDQFREWVNTISEELGYVPSGYAAKVIPTISFSGTVDGQPVADIYAPEFNMTFGAIQARMEPELVRSEEEIVETMEVRDQYFRWWRINWRIEDVQNITGLLAIVLLLPSSILALLLYTWLHDDELFLIQARYGGMLITVDQVDLHQSRQIQVASIKDLARLAQQYGGVIFQKGYNDGSHLFFIPDGQLTYLLIVPDRKKGT